MQTRSAVAAVVLAGVLAIVAPSVEAQDLTGIPGANEDPVLNMKLNYVRTDVRDVQRRLEARGYDPRTTDGILWPWTREALERFQKEEGLRVTGTLDADTVGRLRAGEPAAASPPSR